MPEFFASSARGTTRLILIYADNLDVAQIMAALRKMDKPRGPIGMNTLLGLKEDVTILEQNKVHHKNCRNKLTCACKDRTLRQMLEALENGTK